MYPRRAYVLHCLPVPTGEDEEVTWRFSIQEAEPEAERHAFNSLEALVAYLSADLARKPVAEDRE